MLRNKQSCISDHYISRRQISIDQDPQVERVLSETERLTQTYNRPGKRQLDEEQDYYQNQ